MLTKAVVLFLIACVLSATFLAFYTTSIEADSSVLRVPQDYFTIQAAINAANTGDTILVAEGIYPEHVIVDRSVSLFGQNKTATIIDGNITIFESSVTVRGFTIRNGYPNGITVFDSANITISGNIIVNHKVGVLWSGVNSSTVGANTIISNNLTGVAMGDSFNNTIFGNLMEQNKDQNIGLVWSSNNTIVGNRINSSMNGVVLTGSSMNNTIVGNVIAKNSKGVSLDSSAASNNRFHHNSFSNNTKQVVNKTSTFNEWDNGYPSGGNYWSDYTGVDANSDAIGDVPYVIDANNRDRYPLMTPWVDVKAPSTADNYDGLWHTSDFTITLTADDDKIGVAETYYRIDTELPKSVLIDGQPLIVKEGIKTLEYWSIDWCGNEETPHKILSNVKLDKTNPSISITLPTNGSVITSSTVTVAWEGLDVISGIAYYEVTLDNEPRSNVGTNTTHTFFDVVNGSHRVEVKAFDKSGRTQTAFVNFTAGASPAGWWGYIPMVILGVVLIVVGFGVFYYFKKSKAVGRKKRRQKIDLNVYCCSMYAKDLELTGLGCSNDGRRT